MRADGFWRACGIPVLLSLGAITAVNALRNYVVPDDVRKYTYSFGLYPLAGGLLPLLLLWRAVRAGRKSRKELGLAPSGRGRAATRWPGPR